MWLWTLEAGEQLLAEAEVINSGALGGLPHWEREPLPRADPLLAGPVTPQIGHGQPWRAGLKSCRGMSLQVTDPLFFCLFSFKLST